MQGLRSGALDVALVSSIELFRQPGYGYLAAIEEDVRQREVTVHDHEVLVAVGSRGKEQLEEIKARGEALGKQGLDEVNRAWPQLISEVKAEMLKGSFDIFKGELKDNTGKVVIPKGTAIKQTDPVLEGMNYLVEGVIGKA